MTLCSKQGAVVVSCEAATTIGWDRYAHASVGVNSFGMSGKGAEVYKHFDVTAEAVARQAQVNSDECNATNQ